MGDDAFINFNSVVLDCAPGDDRRRDADQLTDREREVLVLMARGLSNAEIAKALSWPRPP